MNIRVSKYISEASIKSRENEIIEVAEFIGVKSYKAKGKRMTNYMVENIQEIEPVVKKESVVASDENPDEEPTSILL